MTLYLKNKFMEERGSFFAHPVIAVPQHTISLFLAECKWSLLGKSGA